MSMSLIIEHLYIVLASGVLAILIGLPLGTLAYMNSHAKPIILKVVDILQTIPCLALLGLIMVLSGAGKTTVIIGITLYSLLPIVRNTCLGLEEVSPGVKEAARGMGMSKMHRLLRVEYPLAFPTIFTGIRIAIVNAISTAVFAAFVGGGGIGSILTRGIRIQDMKLILVGTGALMLIAIVIDLFMSFCESKMRKSHGSIKLMLLPLVVLLCGFVIILPFNISKASSSDELVMYDGDYSETQIMTHMAKILIEDKTDLNVVVKDQMSQVNNFKAMMSDTNSCDMMICYDGTLLTTFLHLDPSDVPKGITLYDYANERGLEDKQVYLLDKLGFDNTYAIAVTKEVADKYGIEKVSDLKQYASQLVFGAEHEFFTEEGSMKYGPFVDYYGLNFKESVSVDVSLKYSAVEQGSFDVTEVYATDGLNKKAGLVVLEDDKEFFPEYNGAFLVKKDTFSKFKKIAPNLEEVMATLSGKISTEDMINMTYDVDVNGKSVDDVAREFLEKNDLI